MQNPYAPFLDQVLKPARYIGGEKFQVNKRSEEINCKIALCFPDVYEIGMGHLGFKILYHELNQSPALLAHRVFAPWTDMEKKMREENLPLVTLEDFTPLSEYNILGFSLQYELTYTNILMMLDLGGVTLLQKDRGENEPFVIAGGPCATHPEPLAPFMDFIVIGDGEELFCRIGNFIGNALRSKRTRSEILKELSTWEGIYVPSLVKTAIDPLSGFEVVTDTSVKRFLVPSLKDYPIPTTSPIPHLTAIFDRYSVELARGCTEGCRFCQAGMIYRPVRERRPTDVIDAVMQGMEKGGFEEASLTCLSTADYSAITPLLLDLLDKVQERGGTLGVSSLRAYGLDPAVLDKMAQVKNGSLTFAPEAGTDRMRKVIAKNITEKDMLNTANEVFKRNFQKMKLYFMIGLPTETDEDVLGIMETGRKAKLIAHQNKIGNPQITISVSSFVPKPHTPFQWHTMIELSEIERKQQILKEKAFEYRLKFRKHFSKSSIFEAVIARGDRRVGDLIYRAYQKGARFDGWDESFSYELWMQAVEEINLDLNIYLNTIRIDARLPWDHIDVGLAPGFLAREWVRALENRTTIPCGKPAYYPVHQTNLEKHVDDFEVKKKKLVCYHCGIQCDLTQMVSERKEYLTSLQAFHPPQVTEEKNYSSRKPASESKRGQNVGYTYRVEFAKLGPLSFISHLDLQKVITRIFKRAKLPVLFSEGFHKRALVSFGPALSLGVCSLSEFLDVRVPEPLADYDQFCEELNLHSEKGLIFKRIYEISRSTPSIQLSAKEQTFIFPVEPSNKEFTIKKVINSILEAKNIWIEGHNVKLNTPVIKDLKPRVLNITECSISELPVDKEELSLIEEVVPIKEYPLVAVKVQLDEGKSVRADELMQMFSQFGLKAKRPVKSAQILDFAS